MGFLVKNNVKAETCPDKDDHCCIWGPYHMVLSRPLTLPEWSYFSAHIDEYWTGSTWHPEGCAYLIRQISDKAQEEEREEVTVVGFEP